MLVITCLLFASTTIDADEPEFRLGGSESWELDRNGNGASKDDDKRPKRPAARRVRSAAEQIHLDPSRTWKYTVTAPPGLQRLDGELPNGLVEYHRSPSQKVSFAVARFPTQAPVQKFARRMVTKYTTSLDWFKVRHLAHHGGSGNRFVVELDSKVAGTRLRQVQVYERMGRSILVLTYTAPVRRWDDHKRFFLRSIESFRVTQVNKDGEKKKPNARKRPDQIQATPDAPDSSSGVGAALRGLFDGLKGK